MPLPLGFFAPLPNPVMIPFMGIQSAIMAKMFGEYFQYGKRKIQAMSNEEFNRLDATQLSLRNRADVQDIVTALSPTLQDFDRLVPLILDAFRSYLDTATISLRDSVIQGVNETVEGLAPDARNIGQAISNTDVDVSTGLNNFFAGIGSFFNQLVPNAFAESGPMFQGPVDARGTVERASDINRATGTTNNAEVVDQEVFEPAPTQTEFEEGDFRPDEVVSNDDPRVTANQPSQTQPGQTRTQIPNEPVSAEERARLLANARRSFPVRFRYYTGRLWIDKEYNGTIETHLGRLRNIQQRTFQTEASRNMAAAYAAAIGQQRPR